MKFRPVGAELFHVDGQTDRQKDRWTGRSWYCYPQFWERA